MVLASILYTLYQSADGENMVLAVVLVVIAVHFIILYFHTLY